MTILVLKNTASHHFEVIESILVKHKEIIGVNADIIYMSLHYKEQSFMKYISERYPKIIFSNPSKYDYRINITLLKEDKIQNSKTEYYIGHNKNEDHEKMDNVFWLSPFQKNRISADILPFTDQRKMNKSYPIYLIQGNKQKGRRNFNLLENILKQTYKHKFVIRWVGHLKIPGKFDKYIKNGTLEDRTGNFIEFHKLLLDCYCILPLTLKHTNSHYYKHKLTSTMNYAKAYKFKCLIDKDLQDIYNLEHVEIFNDENDICKGFEKTLDDFYKK